MLKADEQQVLDVFTLIHGHMSTSCYTKFVYDDDDLNLIAIACMKDGNECWRSTLKELALDLAIINAKHNGIIP